MYLNEAIDQYVSDRRSKGIAASTIRNDRTTLGQLLAAIGNVQTHYIGPKQLDRFWAAYPDWSAGTWNLKRAVLMGFFEWLRKRGHMSKTHDPLDGLRKRRVPKRPLNLVPQSQFEELLAAAENPRDRALVAIGLYLFTRVSETTALRWRDFDFDGKTVAVYRYKTEDFDILPMCEELEEEMRRWKFEYGRLVGEVPRLEWYVTPRYSRPRFKGGAGGRLYMHEPPTLMPQHKLVNVTTAVKSVLQRLGYDAEQEGGHTLRRSGATALYHELSRVGHDRAIRMCQAMLGHKNLATTEVYLSLDLDKKARNDLLAGKRMFAADGGQVVDLEALDGETDAGAV